MLKSAGLLNSARVMNKDFKKIATVLLFVTLITTAGYLAFFRKHPGNDQLSFLALIMPNPTENSNQENKEFKTFTFENFHGSSDISDKFRFHYPASWHNKGQYFSPQPILFYNLFTVKAPIYFDLILADIFNQTELSFQIDVSKRKSPDTTGQIDGIDFKKYDLIDYGTYGGESAGRVKIFVGPKIEIDSRYYYLVFHWEEKPLAEYMPGNNIGVFDDMLLTLKFFH